MVGYLIIFHHNTEMQINFIPRTFMAAFQIETSNCPGDVLLEGICLLVICMAVLGILYFLFYFVHKTFLLIIKAH
jgi:hypothetical protein